MIRIAIEGLEVMATSIAQRMAECEANQVEGYRTDLYVIVNSINTLELHIHGEFRTKYEDYANKQK